MNQCILVGVINNTKLKPNGDMLVEIVTGDQDEDVLEVNFEGEMAVPDLYETGEIIAVKAVLKKKRSLRIVATQYAMTSQVQA